MCFVADLRHSSFIFTHIHTQTNTIIGSNFATSDPVITLKISRIITRTNLAISAG
jgi:hypothetical protein